MSSRRRKKKQNERSAGRPHSRAISSVSDADATIQKLSLLRKDLIEAEQILLFIISQVNKLRDDAEGIREELFQNAHWARSRFDLRVRMRRWHNVAVSDSLPDMFRLLVRDIAFLLKFHNKSIVYDAMQFQSYDEICSYIDTRVGALREVRAEQEVRISGIEHAVASLLKRTGADSSCT